MIGIAGSRRGCWRRFPAVRARRRDGEAVQPTAAPATRRGGDSRHLVTALPTSGQQPEAGGEGRSPCSRSAHAALNVNVKGLVLHDPRRVLYRVMRMVMPKIPLPIWGLGLGLPPVLWNNWAEK